MKRLCSVTLVFLLACGFSQAEDKKAYDAMLTVQLVDDSEHPIPSATIAASTFKKWHPGDGFGRDENLIVTGITDTNGLVELEVSCISGTVSLGVRDMPGYYQTYSEKFSFKKTEGGKWIPWNPKIKLTLKRVVNPIPLYAKIFKTPYQKSIPVEGKPIGFDLEKGDWVTPYGNGKIADFIFTLRKENERTVTYGRYGREATLFDTTLSVKFSNDGDGIQSVYSPSGQGSRLKLDREAPENNYVAKIEKRICRTDPEKPIQYLYYEGDTQKESDSNNKLQGQNYFFRVRSKKDDDGNVISALYGKIYGDIDYDWEGFVGFTYYLNPIPNDRNLEFDPSQNLFKNLSPTETVQEP